MPLFPSPQALALAAATPVAGYALVNGTGNIITWTAPNDGLQHRALIFATLHITSGETGGALSLSYFSPDGTNAIRQINAGGGSTGITSLNVFTVIAEAGQVVAVQQTSALTGGAATFWAEIWGS